MWILLTSSGREENITTVNPHKMANWFQNFCLYAKTTRKSDNKFMVWDVCGSICSQTSYLLDTCFSMDRHKYVQRVLDSQIRTCKCNTDVYKVLHPEEEGTTFLRNVSDYSPYDTVSCSKRPESSQIFHSPHDMDCTINQSLTPRHGLYTSIFPPHCLLLLMSFLH